MGRRPNRALRRRGSPWLAPDDTEEITQTSIPGNPRELTEEQQPGLDRSRASNGVLVSVSSQDADAQRPL
jgi:hypothetical protein